MEYPTELNDPEHDRSLITGNLPALRAFSRTLCRSPTDADDLVQETLVKALGSLHQYEAGTRMKSWLFTIMRNTFYTNIKKAVRERPGLLGTVGDTLSIEASQEWPIRGREIGQAIENLPAAQREVLVLVTVLGNSYEETARVCGCNIGTVKSRLNRARGTLLVALGEGTTSDAVNKTGQISRHDLTKTPVF